MLDLLDKQSFSANKQSFSTNKQSFLLDKIQQDLKQTQLAKDELGLSTLRMLLSEIYNAKIQKGNELSDQDIISVVQKEAKKRKEAALGFRQGSREEAALKEEAELKVLETYLPKQLSDEELIGIVQQVITETGANTIVDMGKVIGAVMGKVSGQVDGSRVSNLVKERLS